MGLGKWFAKTNKELGEQIAKLETDLAAAQTALKDAEASALSIGAERDKANAALADSQAEVAKLKTELEAAKLETAKAAAVTAPKVAAAAVELAAQQGVPVADAPKASSDGPTSYAEFVDAWAALPNSEARAEFWGKHSAKFKR